MARQDNFLLPESVNKSYARRLGVALSLAILAMVAFGLVVSAQASASLEEDVETTALVSYIDVVSKVGFGLIALNGYVVTDSRERSSAGVENESTAAD